MDQCGVEDTVFCEVDITTFYNCARCLVCAHERSLEGLRFGLEYDKSSQKMIESHKKIHLMHRKVPILDKL